MTEQNLKNEFSRVVTVSRISSNGAEENIEASSDEMKALSKRFDLVGINKLAAKIYLEPRTHLNKQVIAADGRVYSTVRQRCVKTLEEVTNKLDFTFSVLFVKDGDFSRNELSELENGSLMSEEEIDIYYNGKIDLGELIAQQMFVNLDKYPRKI